MNMNATVFPIPFHTSAPGPAFTRAAPIMPPISACDELVGRPKYHVMMFQPQAPTRVPNITALSTIVISIMPLPMVLATCRPKKKNATKLKNAAQMTAYRGERTRVETIVAIELAESWNPFRKSNSSARAISNNMAKVILCLFYEYGLHDMGDILADIEHRFGVLVYLFPFYKINRVFRILK